MGHEQKGKGSKRKKSWHRGRSESRRNDRVQRRWPDLGVPAQPPAEPEKLKRTGDGRILGDRA